MNTFKPHTNGHLPPPGVAPSDRVEFTYGDGQIAQEQALEGLAETVPWKMVKRWRMPYPRKEATPTGAKVNYYRVQVKTPIHDDQAPYTAECGDVATALGLTGDEFECFKAIWRRAAGRQGMLKTGVSDAESQKYNAEKAAHYGARVLASFNDYGI